MNPIKPSNKKDKKIIYNDKKIFIFAYSNWGNTVLQSDL